MPLVVFSAVFLRCDKVVETSITGPKSRRGSKGGGSHPFLLSKVTLITLETTVTDIINAMRGRKQMIDLTQGIDDIAPIAPSTASALEHDIVLQSANRTKV